MPKRTDAEWQALDARIAREVMGWVKWNEIPQAEREAVPEVTGGRWDYLRHGFSSDEYETFRKEGRQAFWWKHSKPGWIHAQEIRDWQPHKVVAQTLMAVHKIIEQGWWFRLDAGCRFYAGVRARFAWAASYKAYYVGYDKLEAKAICLALEAWLDAQGDGASGQTHTHRREVDSTKEEKQ